MSAERPIGVLIGALGGQGGGVLARPLQNSRTPTIKSHEIFLEYFFIKINCRSATIYEPTG